MNADTQFRALFQDAYPALRRYALHRGLSDQDADDLVAGTLEIAWRRIDVVPTDEPLPWLYAVARNLMRNQHRKEKRRETLLYRLSRVRLSDVRDDPAGTADLDAGAIRKALSELNEEDAELLRLVAWDGLSPAQAAVVIGCTAVAARTRLHRARNRLAARLGVDRRPAPVSPRSRWPGPGHIQVRKDSPLNAAEVRHD